MRVPRVRAIRPDRTGVPGVAVMVVRPLAVRRPDRPPPLKLLLYSARVT